MNAQKDDNENNVQAHDANGNGSHNEHGEGQQDGRHDNDNENAKQPEQAVDAGNGPD
jgi:hypothetical protein